MPRITVSMPAFKFGMLDSRRRRYGQLLAFSRLLITLSLKFLYHCRFIFFASLAMAFMIVTAENSFILYTFRHLTAFTLPYRGRSHRHVKMLSLPAFTRVAYA